MGRKKLYTKEELLKRKRLSVIRWKKAHPDQVAKINKKAAHKYKQAHLEEFKERSHNFYIKNKDKLKLQTQAWRRSDVATVYTIRNIITEECYIGSTLRKLRARLHQHNTNHLYVAKRHQPLPRAIALYGIQNFEIIELETCAKDIARIREQYWIDVYRDKGIRLYNQRNSYVEK